MVCASAALKLVEDRARHRADKEANNSPTQCKGDASLRDSVWKDIKVGDVIRITNHQAVPADVLVLAAHEPEPAVPRGACHVETKVRVRVRVS